MKLYIVSKMDYDEFEILGAFSTKEKAEEYREWKFGGMEDYWRDDAITEVELDDYEGDINNKLRVWHIRAGKNYDFSDIKISHYPSSEAEEDRPPMIHEYKSETIGLYSVHISVAAYTKEEAIHKAKEFCMEYKKDIPRIVENIKKTL